MAIVNNAAVKWFATLATTDRQMDKQKMWCMYIYIYNGVLISRKKTEQKRNLAICDMMDGTL